MSLSVDNESVQSEFFLNQLLDASIEGILAFDRDCRYTAWNQAMEAISGMKREEVIGKVAFEVFPFLKETGVDKYFYAALEGYTATSHLTPYTVPETGRQGFFKGHYSPLRDQQNQIVGGVSIVYDVTEAKRADEAAQEAHKRLTFHFENSPLAVIEWDSDARVSRWSESAERLFGWKAEEVLGKHVADWHFVFDEDIDAVLQVTQRQRIGAELHGVQRNRNYTRDGSVLYCEWYNSVLHDGSGRMLSILSLVLDVTARKAAEEERAALLARERELRKQAEEADRLKDEFLATLSHELRTPLTSILGWATLLRTGDIEKGNIPAGIQIIERNARSQARLIDDLLDVSRIIKGNLKLDVHPLNLAPLLRTTSEALRPAAEAKGITVELELDSDACIVSGDATRLRQVVWNLLMNAIKFTPREGNVNVILTCISEPDESSVSDSLSGRLASAGSPCVRLTVTDTGEGIKPEFLPYVFHRFRQEESSISRRAGGLGLGLAVVRHLVELHGGTVSARSAGRGHGSTFIVELPLAQERRDEVEPVKPSVSPVEEFVPVAMERGNREQLYGVRILLVEDDDDSRNLLAVLLKRQGAQVIATSSAAEALEALVQRPMSRVQGQTASTQDSALSTQHFASDTLPLIPAELPDLIISDLGMPEEDGYQFISKVRSLDNQHPKPDARHRTPDIQHPSIDPHQLPLITREKPPSTPHLERRSELSAVARIPAIALTGYATSKDRERALAAGYQLHLAKPVEPNELVEAILSVLRG